MQPNRDRLVLAALLSALALGALTSHGSTGRHPQHQDGQSPAKHSKQAGSLTSSQLKYIPLQRFLDSRSLLLVGKSPVQE